jgi:hypothetical protein
MTATQTAWIDSPLARGPRRRLVILPLLLGVCACAPLARFETAGEIAGQAVSTEVDSRAAAYYLESYRPGRVDDPGLTARLDAALAENDPAPGDRLALQALTRELSADVATLHYIARLYDQPDNRDMQDRYHRLFGEITSSPREDVIAELERFRDYQIVFVPGYAYRSNPANGADFSRQRALLTELGFTPILIETEELGSVAANAAMITDVLRDLAAQHDKLVLVSASKGGAETAMALNALRTEPVIDKVRAWISVGGLLRGSPYADRYLSGIKRWVARLMLKRQGQPEDILDDLSTVRRRPAFDNLTLPPDVLLLHYVGAPLSGDVRDETRGRYKLLRRLGPNDGLTLLADELTDGGLVVTEVGLDHYFRAPDIDLRTVALTYAVLDELEQREGMLAETASKEKLSLVTEPLPPTAARPKSLMDE